MTSAALSAGCALVAFGPSLSLLFLIAYEKAQLIIVVTTAAFAYLLSTLLASLLWLPVPASLRSNPFLLVPLSVVCQFLFRCGFVHLYHRVEAVIQKSIRKHERHEAELARRRQTSSAQNRTGGEAATPQVLSETSRLRLELNDWSCCIAAGNGFGGMHAVLLYGTLLASEAGSDGTLFQESCSFMPSLVNSAVLAFLFSILDMFLMLLTFYGMRRRKDGTTPAGSAGVGSPQYVPEGGGGASVCAGRFPLPRFPNSTGGGNAALLVAFFAHLAAGIATAPNLRNNGCVVALPAVTAVVALTVLIFVLGVSGHYLPGSQIRRLGQNDSTPMNVSHED